ncbi:hypothetical protein [Myroides pelagicus]|uniref:DUF4292 domain-containing protein n=1 Tax=Myroides pelagicus TaxID=270914 RepID=A0A7K1GMK8_9FLAO|nr:hypothetical protein [Myroides pelagicus]MEC4113277.1 hypothetical protein [Myroides pelagicus]MTH29444.1 hypothetical protein [Myroides pelagicus]
MIRVLVISLCVLFTYSCKTVQLADLPKQGFLPTEQVVENSYFAKIGEEHIFRANITLFKNELSGLIVIKRIDDQQHRVVLTSDFGNTLFDFSIYSDKYAVNYAMSDINKKFILSILARDFQLFTATRLPVMKKRSLGDEIVYLGKYNKLKNVVVWDNPLARVSRLVYGTPKKAKAVYNYTESEDGKAILSIEHYNFPMRIKLIPLVEE